ncbi:MAG: hypothetical protein ACK4NO_02575 [Glycocaulis sp.]
MRGLLIGVGAGILGVGLIFAGLLFLADGMAPEPVETRIEVTNALDS